MRVDYTFQLWKWRNYITILNKMKCHALKKDAILLMQAWNVMPCAKDILPDILSQGNVHKNFHPTRCMCIMHSSIENDEITSQSSTKWSDMHWRKMHALCIPALKMTELYRIPNIMKGHARKKDACNMHCSIGNKRIRLQLKIMNWHAK